MWPVGGIGIRGTLKLCILSIQIRDGLPNSRFDSYSLAECWYEGSKARYLVICLVDNNPQVTHGETVGPGCLPVKECAESHSEAIISPSVGSRKYESDLKSDALNGLGVRGPSWAPE